MFDVLDLPETTEAKRQWWIGFSDSQWTAKRLWRRFFTVPDLRHCWCWTGMHNGTLAYEPKIGRCEFTVSPDPPWMVTQQAWSRASCILVLPPRERYGIAAQSRLMTCASLVAMTMGIDCAAVTPQGLHAWLLRNGAEPLTRWPDPSGRDY